jgi:hypothetical protein
MNPYLEEVLPPVLFSLFAYIMFMSLLGWADGYVSRPERVIVENHTVMQQTPSIQKLQILLN